MQIGRDDIQLKGCVANSLEFFPYNIDGPIRPLEQLLEPAFSQWGELKRLVTLLTHYRRDGRLSRRRQLSGRTHASVICVQRRCATRRLALLYWLHVILSTWACWFVQYARAHLPPIRPQNSPKSLFIVRARKGSLVNVLQNSFIQRQGSMARCAQLEHIVNKVRMVLVNSSVGLDVHKQISYHTSSIRGRIILCPNH